MSKLKSENSIGRKPIADTDDRYTWKEGDIVWDFSQVENKTPEMIEIERKQKIAASIRQSNKASSETPDKDS